MKNRLNLDFTLQTSAERKKFVDEYIKNNNIQFTPQEIETMSNYILWGKEEDGKNVVQKKLVEIDTKHTTWSNRRSVESLETLMDNPSFDENSLQKVGTFIPTKTKKPTFDRTEAL